MLNVLDSLPAFIPSSWGSYPARSRLTIEAVNESFPALLALVETCGYPAVRELSIADFRSRLRESTEDPHALKELLDAHGSDKATTHDYYLMYARLLADPATVRCLFEIGLGTNNDDVVSTMGKNGRPGASLRAFRDYLPSAQVLGADIDRRVLFTEDRIRTFFLDQTNSESWAQLEERVPENCDLLIDDGLHSPHANLRSLEFGLRHVREGGWVVIEDIAPASANIWRVVGALLSTDSYVPYLVRTRHALVFAVQRVEVDPDQIPRASAGG